MVKTLDIFIITRAILRQVNVFLTKKKIKDKVKLQSKAYSNRISIMILDNFIKD